MLEREVVQRAIKALTITDQTVLFVDINQVKVRDLEECEGLPKGLLIIGVAGEPNVLAMSRAELKAILERGNRQKAVLDAGR